MLSWLRSPAIKHHPIDGLIWWERGLSRSFAGFALSFTFRAGRAAMPHIAMVSVTAIGRTVIRCVRKPVRLEQVTPSVVRIERVAAMHAGLDLDLGLGSHAGQGTRHGPKSVLVSDRRRTSGVSPNIWRAIQSDIASASELVIFRN
jgi:hypothetical protein